VAYATKLADAEQCVACILDRAPAITAYTPTLDPNMTAEDFPCVTFVRVGGGLVSQVPAVYDGARIQVDAWGDTPADAWDMMSTAWLRLLPVSGIVNDLDGVPAFVVSGVSESLSPRWNPEAGSQRARYTGELQVYVRAA
jgi:hypothetical protein